MPDSAAVTANQYREAQRAEWGTYVATAEININGARAFNPGDPVPSSHVDAGIVDSDQVAKLTTKSGRAAAGLDESPKG